MRFCSLALILLAGCSTIVKTPEPPSVPVAVSGIKHKPLPKIALVTRNEAVGPKSIRVYWEYPPNYPVTFEIWTSTNMINWDMSYELVDLAVVLPMKDVEFFRVRAKDLLTGELSNWATTK